MSRMGVTMILEHAKTVNEIITMEELNYMVKKANRLGKMNREITRVYAQEDDEGRHIYFEVEGPKPPSKVPERCGKLNISKEGSL